MAKTSSPVPSEPMSDKERQIKYQTEDDLRALTRAEEIKADPVRLKRVKGLADEQSSELNAVTASLAKRGLISEKAAAKIKPKGKTDAED